MNTIIQFSQEQKIKTDKKIKECFHFLRQKHSLQEEDYRHREDQRKQMESEEHRNNRQHLEKTLQDLRKSILKNKKLS